MTDRLWHSFAGVVSVSIALFAGSCTSDGDRDRGDRNLPRIGDLRPRGGRIDDPYPTLHPPQPVALYQRRTLPLTTNLDELWKLTSTDSLANETVELWRANGMRVGVMKVEQVKAMQAAMAEYTGVGDGFFPMSKYYSPLYTAPRLAGPTAIKLIEQPETPRRIVLTGGRVRFLVKLRRDEDDRVMLDLVPQHHRREKTLTPRSPLETILDGVVFESLKLTTELRTDRLVLIGLDLPPPPEDEPAPESVEPADTDENDSARSDDSGTPPDADEPDKDAPPAAPAQPPKIDVPFHLGRILLTASRVRRPLQLVFVFGLYMPPPIDTEGDVDRETRQMMRELRGRTHGRPGR
jgi:hypothetical protein